MDLTRAVRYRNFDLNTIQSDAVTRDMVGCEITRVTWGGIEGVGYEEKKALADGMDVSDVFLGKRVVRLSGNVYGRTRTEAFTYVARLMEALSPRAAYESNASQKGFVPLDFYQPLLMPFSTYVQSGTPSVPLFSQTQVLHLMLLARPMAQPVVDFISDASGGATTDALAIPWEAVMECANPAVMNAAFTQLAFSGTGAQSGSATNRGNRPAAIEFRFLVPPHFNNGAAGSIVWVGLNNSFTVTVPDSAHNQAIWINTREKIVSINGVLRMDVLTFYKGYDWRLLPPGRYNWTWKRIGKKPLTVGSFARFRDTWA